MLMLSKRTVLVCYAMQKYSFTADHTDKKKTKYKVNKIKIKS